MNTFIIILDVIGVLIFLNVMLLDWLKVKAKYKVKNNGKLWVVRDSRGRFVIITPSFFDVLTLGTYKL